MIVKIWLLSLFVLSILDVANLLLIQAIAFIRDYQNSNVTIAGNITFTQNDEGSVTIWGKIEGLEPGKHGFHIHETGDLSAGCNTTGPHYNPLKKKHGSMTSEIRHAGDLGNVIANNKGIASISIVDNVISLVGPHTVLGRSIVIHEEPDDLGRGGFPDSETTGHSGSKIACGVIGLLTPLDSWVPTSSAKILLPWKTIFIIIFLALQTYTTIL